MASTQNGKKSIQHRASISSVQDQLLNENLFLEICLYLPYMEIGTCLFVCQGWLSSIQSYTILWKKMYQDLMVESCTFLLNDEDDDYLHSYRSRYQSGIHSLNILGYPQANSLELITSSTFFHYQFHQKFCSTLKFPPHFNWKEKFLNTLFITQQYLRDPDSVLPILPSEHLLSLPPIRLAPLGEPPDHAQVLVHRGGHNAHVLRHQEEDYLILLGGDIPVQFGELATLDVIQLRTREVIFLNHSVLPSPITSTWLNCSVKIQNKIYLVQYTATSTRVMKIFLTSKKRFIESKLMDDRDYQPRQQQAQLQQYPQSSSSQLLFHSSLQQKTPLSSPAHLPGAAPTMTPGTPSANPAASSTPSSSSSLSQQKPQRPIRGSSLVLDPVPIASSPSICHRCVMFGGEVDNHANENNLEHQHLDPLQRYLNDVYLLYFDEKTPDIVEWQRIIATGDKPCPRSAHSVSLIDRQMFVFGGWTSSQVFHQHLQQQHQPTNPMKVKEKAKEQFMATIVAEDVFLNDLFVLNIDIFHWQRVETFGIPPVPRCQTAMITMPAFSRQSYSLYSQNTTSSSSNSSSSSTVINHNSNYLLPPPSSSRRPSLSSPSFQSPSSSLSLGSSHYHLACFLRHLSGAIINRFAGHGGEVSAGVRWRVSRSSEWRGGHQQLQRIQSTRLGDLLLGADELL